MPKFSFRLIFFIIYLLFCTNLFSQNAEIIELDLSYKQFSQIERPNSWQEMIDSFSMPFPHKSQQVEQQVQLLLQNRYHLSHSLKKMAPYLPLFLSEVKKQGLPAEVIIIPLIESCYTPSAQSCYGAKGLWQMIETTGQDLGLYQSKNFDPLFDIILSTRAALTHLKKLHHRFGSWVLALAAYNAGSSRLTQALKKANFRHDMDFFKLDLPEQTLEYVPKILAFSHLIEYSDCYKINLPDCIDSLVSITFEDDYDFTTIALALGQPVSSFARYNKQYLDNAVVFSEPKNFVLPKSLMIIDRKTFNKRLSFFKHHPYYTICQSDTLIGIGKRFNISLSSLREFNDLKSSKIYQGQSLRIPQVGLSKIAPIEYIIQPGDCLSLLAKRYQTTVIDLQKMNDLRDTKLFIGQKLIIRR